MDLPSPLSEQIHFLATFRDFDPDAVGSLLAGLEVSLAELIALELDARQRAERAEAELAALQEQRNDPSAGTVPIGALSEEQEIELASRTLRMAKRAADAEVAEAHIEATTLVTEARTLADQLNQAARAENERLIHEARESIEGEFRQSRKRFADEIKLHEEREEAIKQHIASLEEREQAVKGHIASFEERLAEYRSDIERVHDSLGAMISDQGDLSPRRPLDLDRHQ